MTQGLQPKRETQNSIKQGLRLATKSKINQLVFLLLVLKEKKPTVGFNLAQTNPLPYYFYKVFRGAKRLYKKMYPLKL